MLHNYLGLAEQSYNRLLIGILQILRTSKCKVLANGVSKQLHFSLSGRVGYEKLSIAEVLNPAIKLYDAWVLPR